ncbi:hypothetical protein AM1_H0073 (plasmid) [Acaryochloris marina MBIC11017]|uniref:Uncharacterized protein n=1 Tax=Acaryochloris marina (strain MBIC 11017) TaxID=329726 RepID=A8ZQY7_ACAM1|nr:hypothetical protein AM1_H0073 [Acaryochloris marina MBIC11017]
MSNPWHKTHPRLLGKVLIEKSLSLMTNKELGSADQAKGST